MKKIIYRLEITEVAEDLKSKESLIVLYLGQNELFELEEKLRQMKRL